MKQRRKFLSQPENLNKIERVDQMTKQIMIIVYKKGGHSKNRTWKQNIISQLFILIEEQMKADLWLQKLNLYLAKSGNGTQILHNIIVNLYNGKNSIYLLGKVRIYGKEEKNAACLVVLLGTLALLAWTLLLYISSATAAVIPTAQPTIRMQNIPFILGNLRALVPVC